MEIIEQIRARQITVPLEEPVWLGGYSVTEREYCLLELTTRSGLRGHSLAFTRGIQLARLIEEQLGPVVSGEPADEVERLWDAMYQRTRLNGRQGALMRAISLMDLALWDLKAKQFDAPLSGLLGGWQSSVPVMMAGGYYHKDKGISELCREFQGYGDEGFRHLKLIVGGASMQEDFERFRAVRMALPQGITLGIDANGAWNDPQAVLRWIREADAVTGGLEFAEEPLPPENRDGLAWLQDASPIPLAVGEFLSGRWTFGEYLRQGCMGIVRADATLCGGISEWRKIAALANASNRSLMPHYFASLHLHLALALPGCSRIEVVSTQGNNSSFHRIAGHSYRLEGGNAIPLNRPGLGLQLDEEFIRAHQTYPKEK